MLNTSVVSFCCDNFGLIIKRSEDVATNGIKIGCFGPPDSQLTPPRARTLANIQTLCCQKLGYKNIFIGSRFDIVAYDSCLRKQGRKI